MDLHPSSALPWRLTAAVCLDVIAAVHIAIAPDHLREAPYAGALFVALATAALATAILLLATQDRLVWAGAAALSLAALLGYFMSRSFGLPALSDDIGDWLNPLGVVAVLSEIALLAIAWQVLRGYRTVTATERLYTVVPASPISPAG